MAEPDAPFIQPEAATFDPDFDAPENDADPEGSAALDGNDEDDDPVERQQSTKEIEDAAQE